MPTPSIQTLTTDAQQVLNLDSISAVRSVVAVALANANTGTPLNPNLTTQQLWDQFYQVVTRPKSDIESIIANQLMKFLFAPPAPGGVGANKQVIFNDGGVLAGAANLYWDKANNRVGIGTASPTVTLDVAGAARFVAAAAGPKLSIENAGGSTRFKSTDTSSFYYSAYDHNFTNTDGSVNRYTIDNNGVSTWYVSGTTAMTLNSTGLGVGASPNAKLTVYGGGATTSTVNFSGGSAGTDNATIASNYNLNFQVDANNNVGGRAFIWRYGGKGYSDGTHLMTLDASGNLLVGTTSGTYHTIRKNVTADAGNLVFEVVGTGGSTSVGFYGVTGYNANAANSATKVGRDATTLRSINAGGTVNASGADYAEYMTKASDFVLSKGDIAGVDANGKLTNVFADAVSFVVKSTDPSYVGNDKWGVDLEGDALEAARQLVDRIAFAGQVPVNVTGAKAGDYIVPVVNGSGIKGIAVNNPTFEQYQLAVGKVIAIDADGRARIIVKVA